jgi:hypothetical protein
MILVSLLLGAAGLIIGFVWGCQATLRSPDHARRFLKGFHAPFRALRRLLDPKPSDGSSR